jgi:hypothetical protein
MTSKVFLLPNTSPCTSVLSVEFSDPLELHAGMWTGFASGRPFPVFPDSRMHRRACYPTFLSSVLPPSAGAGYSREVHS